MFLIYSISGEVEFYLVESIDEANKVINRLNSIINRFEFIQIKTRKGIDILREIAHKYVCREDVETLQEEAVETYKEKTRDIKFIASILQIVGEV